MTTKNNPECVTKHTAYQPPIEEWRCPKCGTAPPDGLCIDESAAVNSSGNSVDCNGNHSADTLLCYKCGYSTNGRAFATACQKKADLVPCACCKGVGFVSRKKKKKP